MSAAASTRLEAPWPRRDRTGRSDLESPRHTSLTSLCARLRATLAPYLDGTAPTPIASERRDALLVEARSAYDRQLRHDLDYNIFTLSRYASSVSNRIQRDVRRIPVIGDLLRRLEQSRRFLRVTDAWSGSRVEEACWLATQQFYCDGLELADRLIDVDHGRSVRHWPRPDAFGDLRRRNLLGITAYSWPTAAGRAVDVLAPNFWQMRFFTTLFPTIWRVLYHMAVPWGGASWAQFERSTLGWLGRDGFRRLRGGGQRGDIRFYGARRVIDDPQLFDRRTNRLRHNVIFCGSHRTGFLDFPFFAHLLRDVPHAVWANNSFYGPGMARKLARDPATICVRGQGKLPIFDAIDRTIDVMKRHGLALFIIADGSQPNMMYGNQVRIKRGIRLLADESVRQCAASGRRTFVVPMSFDDPLGYLCGLDDGVDVTMHRPIEIVSPSTDQSRSSRFDEAVINGGDCLLNQLEALFMCHSLAARHGFDTPRVLETARRRHRQAVATARSPGRLRSYLASRCPTPVSQLRRRQPRTSNP